MPPTIEHLVVLMLENRSFDHMLGYLKSPNYPIDGLDGTQANIDSAGIEVLTTNDADYAGDYNPDPGHDFLDVNEQIFGNSDASPGLAPPMSGFVKNYGRKTSKAAKSHNVMKCFKPEKIPVLTTLARQFAVCDRWFSSVPGPTLPNRAYAHAATSIGHVDMTINWWKESKTIYELLDEHNKDARIYFHDSSMAQTFGGLMDKQDRFFGTGIEDFFDACKNNTLPAYSFVEPRYNASTNGDPVAASDQHPDHDVFEGETLIKDVYNAVRSNPKVWNNTILVVVYDEHGGLYDHVMPPVAMSPDGKPSVNPSFAFDRLGVRVPAIVISPYIEAGTIDSTVYDHASLAATARKLFVPNWQNIFLTERDRNANTFDGLLTRDTPRKAGEVDISGKHNAAVVGHPLTLAQRAEAQAAAPLTDHQKVMVQNTAELDKTLPAGLRSGMDPMAIRTQQQASDFHAQVNANIREAAASKKTGAAAP